MKKLSALLLSVLIIIAALLPMSAGAVVVSLEENIALNPGNTRRMNPQYNYAWLDQLFIRDDANAVVPKEITPTPDDYPYALTYTEFLEECDRYLDVFDINEKTVSNVYKVLIDSLSSLAVAMGFTDETDKMYDYLQQFGMDMPDEITAEDKPIIAIVYAAIEYDAIYLIYGKDMEIPVGITPEGALVMILSAVMGVELPAGADTLEAFGVQAATQYVEDFGELPISEEPTMEELFYWLKVAVARENGYQIPSDKFKDVTPEDEEYVQYVYFSSVLEGGFEVRLDAEELLYARQSEDNYAVHKLILKAMLTEKGVDYSEDESCEKLFNRACKAGYFDLEKEFFSDVLLYEIQVAPSCEKIWFTPITLGDQLNGGDKTPLTLFLQQQYIEPGSTTAAVLNKQEKEETVALEVIYNDGVRQETALYQFRIIKNPDLEKQGEEPSDVLGHVQGFIESVIPSGNDLASEVVSSVFSGIDAIDGVTTATTERSSEAFLTTYEMTTAQTTQPQSPSAQTQESEENTDYLGKLMENLYETDADGNILTTKSYTVTTTEPETTQSIILQVTQTVAENPEIVAAPTGLIALGGFIGFMMNKKHRDSARFLQREDEEKEE